ncbi:MAG TPA: cytochrome c biogenesis protein [Candidatus Absconditabacterales bacterium]|nr:cytochrome c biogenesis protein [Candidatus Absconditabacterales bacterium]HOQ79247.1 cytochrome c biogenesis protein [Candidatus Absconditabacterales bacterium]HPK28113.1 cytochrome c biogenesis protein [Candidatus Absconditabacterales bacterium]
MKRFLFVIVFSLGFFLSFSFAQDYVYFYGNGCTHCAKVEKFFDENDVVSKYNVKELEIYFNRNNLKTFSDYIEKLEIDKNKAGVPFLVIDSENECDYVAGDKKIIGFFQEKLTQDSSKVCAEGEDCSNFVCNDENCPHLNCGEIDDKDISGNVGGDGVDLTSKWGRRKFFAIMLPAAFADSINPCAFAVMLLLLSSILTKTKSKRKAIISGFVFALAVFLSYFAMGLGLFSALATATNTFVIKIIVGILGILVGLANLKDFFWYGKGFIMEVPLAWRPKMQKVIKWAVSPLGVFIVGFLVSLFLLPCTSGPYFTILGYLASESKNLHTRGYIYLIVYNIIFILPMVLIALLVGLGFKSAEELAELKSKNARLIHLIVGLLMLGLGMYVLLTM